ARYRYAWFEPSCTASPVVAPLAADFLVDAALRLRPGRTRLRRLRRAGPAGLCQIVHGRLHAARAMRHAGLLQAHFHARQGGAKRQVVEVAQVPDTENPVRELAQALSQR